MNAGVGEIDVETLEKVGTTDLSDHYLLEPNILLTIYRENSVDTQDTARKQLEFQEDYMRSKGHRFGLLVLIDNLVAQDAASRRVYAKEPSDGVFLGVALVGGSMLSRGVASFFLGISNTAVPMKFFATVRDAQGWFHKLQEKCGD